MQRRLPLFLMPLVLAVPTTPLTLAEDERPIYLEDRGPGIPTSLFGTYVKHKEWLVYPFYEHTTNGESEYKPSELGFVGNEDFLGKSTEDEVVLFVGYGLTKSLALELEAEAWVSASLEKNAADTSALPPRVEESGLGGVESQLRWMWRAETSKRPAFYSFLEVEFPLQKDKALIGVQNWEFAVGAGLIRGFRWGTLNARISLAHDTGENETEPGEYAVEYLKRVSERWGFVATLEGEDDELVLVGEAQWHVRPDMFIKLNSGFGLTEKADDWAPEIGIIFSF